MIYGNTHRYLLRTVASKGVLPLREAERLVQESEATDENENAPKSVKTLIADINNQIKLFQQTIKITNNELTEEEVLVFISLACDETTRSQNIFNNHELEYFHLVIEEIMSTELRQISGISAINVVNKMKGSFSKTDAQKLLNTWCRIGYLDHPDDSYALGIRAIHEFESYFRQHIPDSIEECTLCKQVVFRGCNCPTCGEAIHTRCLNRYIEKVSKWPCCKVDFSELQLQISIGTQESSRLSETQVIPSSTSEVHDTVAETQEMSSLELESTQETVPGISQRLTRKRKRQ